MPKEYSLNGLAGLVETRKNRITGTMISVYHNEQAGMDCCCSFVGTTKHDPEFHSEFSTLCEDHSQIVAHRTLTLARRHAAMPEWCEACQKIMEEKGIFS